MISKRFVLLISLLTIFIIGETITAISITYGSNEDNIKIHYTKVYAIVTSESTYNDPSWHKVIKALEEKYENKYNVTIFVYKNDIWEVRDKLAAILPDYTCFVNKYNEVTASFVKEVNKLTRSLDNDPYGDTIWAILTGYTAEDALRIVRCRDFIVKSMLAGCAVVKWLKYCERGIVTSEIKYGLAWKKFPNGTIVRISCPIDRAPYLAKLLNSNKYDIFITSGHANYNVWQLHYPTPGEEGWFIAKKGVLYAKTHDGRLIRINSTNPKIYFGLGNCYIGLIKDENSMALAWIHSGGAVFYTGYVIKEGPYSYQLGGIPAYFFVQDNYTWAQAFFANNQALIFDMLHKTPGTHPDYLKIDANGAALYGDPALNVRAYHAIKPLYTKEIIVKRLNNSLLNITILIKMNYNGTPGWNGKWGNRHPVILLPFKITNIKVIATNAYKVVVTENFVLMYVWKLGDKPLRKGEIKYVIIIAKLLHRPVKIVKKVKEGYQLNIILMASLVGLSIVLIIVYLCVKKKFIRLQR